MARQMLLRLHSDELVVDNFAGGGGASLGIEWALGRSPDIAINHDPEAVAMHAENHPATKHFCESVWDVDPRRAILGRRVALAWFSPDCKHHSKARGGKPVDKRIRGLAWVVLRWAALARPRVIILENVEEFESWGPVGRSRRITRARRGQTFKRWWGQLEALGYQVEKRILRACDYGAPTIRKRLFIVARCDGEPIVWPEPTHGPGLQPYRTAAECIQWEVPTRSIFERRKPLADNTLRRIARGIQRFVVEAAEPFLIPVTHQGDARVYSLREPMRTITSAHRGEKALVAPTLIQTGYGERPGQTPRVPGLHKPLGTVVGCGVKHALVSAFLARHYGERSTGGWNGGVELDRPISTITAKDHHSLVTSHLLKLYGTCKDGRPVTEPMPTVTATGNHVGEVRAFLTKWYGTGTAGQPLDTPMHTVTARDRFGLVTVDGVDYQISDIGMRMLEPRELYRAQGFPDEYRIDIEIHGKGLTKAAKVKMVGNSVCPQLAEVLVRANVASQAAEPLAEVA